MILYHGSNVRITEVDLERSEVGKDFGAGFYLTDSKEQAERMGQRKARLFGGVATVSSFEFDESAARSAGLAFKEFHSYSREWAEFVLANRANGSRIQIHDFDIVYGPIANDDVGYQIRRLLAGLITMDAFLKGLEFKKGITCQYFFSTADAVSYLKSL